MALSPETWHDTKRSLDELDQDLECSVAVNKIWDSLKPLYYAGWSPYGHFSPEKFKEVKRKNGDCVTFGTERPGKFTVWHPADWYS